MRLMIGSNEDDPRLLVHVLERHSLSGPTIAPLRVPVNMEDFDDDIPF